MHKFEQLPEYGRWITRSQAKKAAKKGRRAADKKTTNNAPEG